MKIGIYARVSTLDKGQDPELQLRELRAFCQARGWTIAGEYVDIGISGAKDSRPELNRLLTDARKRKIDCIVVWKLDRFGRSLKHLVNTLDELISLGIQFVSYTQNFDLTTPMGKLLAQLLAVFSEFERDLIKERVRAGISNARAKGVSLGRPKAYVSRVDLDVMRKKGLSIRDIAKKLKISKSCVHKILHEKDSQNINSTPLSTGIESRP